MAMTLQAPDIRELKPRITVFGVGGAGGNAVNNMIESGLLGCEFVVANTDAQALTSSKAERVIQMGLGVTQGLGAGSHPEVGSAAAEEVIDEIRDQLSGAHMCFITAGMGGGTGTGAAPVIARAARDMGILTVGVVTKPFQFEGVRRMRTAESGINELQAAVDTLIVIPNQKLLSIAAEKTPLLDTFKKADEVLLQAVKGISDLINIRGLINLDFADIRTVMKEKGMAIMGTGVAKGENRAVEAAQMAVSSPLLENIKIEGATGIIVNVTGGADLSLYEVNEASTLITEAAHEDAVIIFGAVHDPNLTDEIRITVIATGFAHEDQKRAADLRPDLTMLQNMFQQQQQQAAPGPQSFVMPAIPPAPSMPAPMPQMPSYAMPTQTFAPPSMPQMPVMPSQSYAPPPPMPTFEMPVAPAPVAPMASPAPQPQHPAPQPAPVVNAAPAAPAAGGLPPISTVQNSVATFTQEHAPVVEQVPSAESATPLAPVEGGAPASRDLLVAKMKAFKESQDIKAKYNQPEQLSMNMEDASLEEARRMAREVLSSPFSGQNLEVPAFIRKKQSFDLNKE